MVDFHAVIIGGGVIGLAIGRALAQSGKEVLVLETASKHGTGTSSRNSGVIHAGIYYKKGSLKHRLIADGRDRLYQYLRERRIPYLNCGKYVISSSSSETDKLNLPLLIKCRSKFLF